MSHALRITRKDIFKNKEYDFVFKLAQRLRTTFIKFCKNNNLKSHKHYKIDYLMLAIELGQCPGQSRRWNIDHIKPSSTFDLSIDSQVKKCWSDSNLVWMIKIVNYEKSNTFPWDISLITKKTMKKLTQEERIYLKEINKRYLDAKKENNND